MSKRETLSIRRLPVAAFFAMGLSLFGCGPQSAPQPEPPALPSMTLQLTDAMVESFYATRLEGREDVEIRPQVDGALQKIFVAEGDYVKAGQPLFQIDDRMYRSAYEAAKASAAVARIEMEKLVPLVENKVVSPVQLQTAKAKYQAAEASAASARINLGYTLIKAPINGFVGVIPPSIGSLVSRNQSAWLSTMSDVSRINAYFSMSEADFMRFRNSYAGKTLHDKLKAVPPVSLVLADGSRFGSTGTLESMSGSFDATTGAIRILAVFPNPGAVLRSGNTGKIVVSSPFKNILLVPQAATTEIQDRVFVVVVARDGKIARRPITAAASTGTDYVVTDGLKEGETIVTAGFERLPDGTVIRPLGATKAD